MIDSFLCVCVCVRSRVKADERSSKFIDMFCKSKYALSTGQEKIPTRNSIYVPAQGVTVSDELLLAILKAFVPQPLNEQQTKGFHGF
jgi:hypothetical protein